MSSDSDPRTDASGDPQPLDAGTRAARSSWAHLEDSELRRELGVAPEAAALSTAMPLVHREGLRFHGKGSEYFRIWVINVFLTLITLGVYSAWAKVRKARWFAQHTSLAGDRFDYHGQPWRVLAGRVVAVLLVLLWSYAFDVAPSWGLGVLALFCVIGPLLFASAQRFKLVNTSWRGLRFGFDVPRRKVYKVCVPLLLLWASSSVLQAFGVGNLWMGVGVVATLAGFPWAHARLKQMQHEHANWGDRRFGFEPAGPEFYGLYASAVVLAIVGGMFVLPVMQIISDAGRPSAMVEGVLVGIAAVALMWLAAWPYFAARMQQIVWARTSLGTARFEGRSRGGALWRLVLVQTLLTLVTLGIYWPFAAVAIARMRIESIAVLTPEPLADVETEATPQISQRAAGDAATDFFGLDIGW